jgi:integrase
MTWIFTAIYDPYVNAGLLRQHPGKVKIRYREKEVADNELDDSEQDRRGGRALTIYEVQLLLHHIYHTYRMLPELLVWTGLRVGEALAMQWRYLDIENKKYNVERNLNRRRQLATPKTISSRASVTLSDYKCRVLEQHRAEQAAERLKTPTWVDQDLIFASSGPHPPKPGRPRADRTFSSALKRAAACAGIPHVTPHDLRHTCATLLIQKYRANIKEVSIHLRHANPTITQEISGHLYSDDLPAMAQAMDSLILQAK